MFKFKGILFYVFLVLFLVINNSIVDIKLFYVVGLFYCLKQGVLGGCLYG